MQALGAPPADLPPAQAGYTAYRPVPPAPESGPRGRSKVMDYTLKGLGLLGVAVLSGFLWWLFRHGSAPGQQADNQGQNAGVYQFATYHGQALDSDCAAHSTEQVQRFLQQHPCQLLTRSLYTATLPDGDEVITAVAVVKMPDASQAAQLRQISDANETGHVKDLVEEGASTIPGGPTNVEDGGYDSELSGNNVIISVTEFMSKAKDTRANLAAAKPTLVAVCKDALRLGTSS
jgi:hypothetical protein